VGGGGGGGGGGGTNLHKIIQGKWNEKLPQICSLPVLLITGLYLYIN